MNLSPCVLRFLILISQLLILGSPLSSTPLSISTSNPAFVSSSSERLISFAPLGTLAPPLTVISNVSSSPIVESEEEVLNCIIIEHLLIPFST